LHIAALSPIYLTPLPLYKAQETSLVSFELVPGARTCLAGNNRNLSVTLYITLTILLI
jgi:hypothetical protein